LGRAVQAARSRSRPTPARSRPPTSSSPTSGSSWTKDLVQQRLAVLAAAGALGQGLGELCLGDRLPARQRLVEQQQHLVEHVDGRLGQQRQQDRVAAFWVTA
jgi:hypothetical protein